MRYVIDLKAFVNDKDMLASYKSFYHDRGYSLGDILEVENDDGVSEVLYGTARGLPLIGFHRRYVNPADPPIPLKDYL